MTLRNLLYVLLFFTFTACNNSSSSAGNEEPISVDSLLSNFEEEEETIPAVDSTALSSEEEDLPPTEMTEKEKEEVKKIKEKRKEIIKEQLSASPFKNCDEVLAKYNELTEAYIKGNDRWKEWDANDVIYNSCKNKADYVPKFSALMDKMDAYDDENE